MVTAEEVRRAWRYADLAYASAKELKDRLGSRVVAVLDPFRTGLGVQCAVFWDGKTLVIAFSGSDDWADWLLDAYAKATPGGLHRGFEVEVSAMAESLLEIVAARSPASVLITGHSLGGAEANMFLEKYAHAIPGETEITCVTFAEPRIAQGRYYAEPCAKQLPNVRYLRVTADGDPVPDLPPPKLGWAHHGDALVIGPAPSWLERRLPLKRFKRHTRAHYSAAVQALK